MAKAATDLMEQGAPVFQAAVLILSQFLKAQLAETERSLGRLLIIGANSVVIKRHIHTSVRPGTLLGGMLTRKPPRMVASALVNKMARIVWTLMARGGVYRAPAAAA